MSQTEPVAARRSDENVSRSDLDHLTIELVSLSTISKDLMVYLQEDLADSYSCSGGGHSRRLVRNI